MANDRNGTSAWSWGRGASRLGLVAVTIASWAVPVFAESSPTAAAPVAPIARRAQMRTSPANRAAASTMAGPTTRLVYYGGPVISNVKVDSVLWGAGSYLPEVAGTATPNMSTFFQGVTNSPYVDWLSEYNTNIPAATGVAGTNQTIGRGSFDRQVQITPSTTSTTVDDAQIQAELKTKLDSGVLSAPTTDFLGYTNTVFAVFVPHGVTVTQDGATSGIDFCAYHATFAHNGQAVYYMVLPDNQPGSGLEHGCGQAPTSFQNLTSFAAHELVETITDGAVGLAPAGPTPVAPIAWYDPNRGEIGDICIGSQATILGGDGVTYTVQKEFSNQQNGCIVVPSPNSGGSGSTSITSTTVPKNSASITRLAGASRVDTAIAISKAVFAATGSSDPSPHAASAVIANAGTFPDALVAAPLAKAKHGPLLLNPTESLDSRVGDELSRILAPGATVYVAGGGNALSEAVSTSITRLGFLVVRYAGATRYDTAVQVAHDGLNDPTTLLVATGNNFPDALSAGAAAAVHGAAVLLTAGDSMPDATASYLAAHAGATTFAIGGPAAVALPSATPLVGTDRYDTATVVARTFAATPTAVGIADGLNFPDALGGGVHIGMLNGPLLLTNPDALSGPTQTYLRQVAGSVTTAFIYGGGYSVGAGVQSSIARALGAS